MFRLPVFLFVFFAFPFLASAQVVITEIMYDPKDADAGSGGEWIEVHNTGSAPIDLTQWIFFEAETNHGITADGGAEIPANGYAVIARDLTAFKNYFSGFSGLLFKASFSLNDGETLAMESDKDAPISDSVSYSSEWGAKNDGNSLQLIDGEWSAATPTPGLQSEAGEENAPAPPLENNDPAPPTSSPNSSLPPPAPLFSVRITTREKMAVVGAPKKFSAEITGAKEGLSGKTRFLWNLGDGGTSDGQSILHTFLYPGDYVVVVDASADAHAVSDRIVVQAIPADVVVSRIGLQDDFFIELSNNSSYELNLSGWLLKSGAQYFVIPERTFILPKKKIIFPHEITKLSYASQEAVGLLYPNGLAAARLVDVPTPVTPPRPSGSEEKAIVPEKKSIPVSSEQPRLNASVEDAVPENVLRPPLPREQGAAVQESTGRSGPSIVWLFAVGGLVLFGVAGMVVARRTRSPADGFTITEEKTDE
ncbi:MAG: hypothetical protein A3D67_02035 [Candidatus Lloydbacteria bacterium RIFCSPHIGHO2_02_FULL_51_22]|uniref:PKD domain-containing protein n=2 Tax=Candidatus Lloydiibacteriota TaxID=1817910 RepID=A0A1G2D9V3_9BACT|nr:MAG: hypothetical protein A3D67_02035 [Candidatus Lloydbacteria bacterium RIFCSPHIGHO2_02_FULL_51_22]OGZ16275.1 MAG: hypothetical protein A3G11_01085 [Candidatus Lloydbacteria bacterium RIFCSPLOWO2_12_FULL_51_9]